VSASTSAFRIGPGSEEREFLLVGELDMASTEMVAAATADLEVGTGDAVLELRDLTFIDSSGILAISKVADRVRGGKLILRHPTEAVRRVLDLVGLTEASPGIVIAD
jgi:anti-anti-sigma factor